MECVTEYQLRKQKHSFLAEVATIYQQNLINEIKNVNLTASVA